MYLAEGFGLTVVAEGVETEAQRDYLLEQRLPYAQGYLYSPGGAGRGGPRSVRQPAELLPQPVVEAGARQLGQQR